MAKSPWFAATFTSLCLASSLTALTALTAITGVPFCCSAAHAEDMDAAALRTLVWSAAQEIESGNVDTAREMLDRAATVEDPPVDVSALISRLQTSLPEQQGQSEPSTTVVSESPEPTSIDDPGMPVEALEIYLDSVSDAIDSLFEKSSR